jgi:hypothetical protein
MMLALRVSRVAPAADAVTCVAMPHVAMNAYVGWACASLLLMANVAFNT